jgi:hypothetical protein
MGGGYDGVIVSFHRSYSEYAKIIERIRQYPFVDDSATLSFLVDLNDKIQYRYFTFSSLAKHLPILQKQEKE